ncbi:MAG: sensor histidine kinase [Blastocatellales bacterium]
MFDTFLAIQTLGFATGTALFALLAVLMHRANKLSAHQHFSPRSAWLGLLWNGCMLAEFIFRLAGISPKLRVMALASSAAYAALAILPTTFLVETVSRYEKRQPLRSKRWLLFFSYAAAFSLAIFLFAGALAPDLRFSHLLELIAYNLVLHLVAIVRLFQLTTDLPARSFVRAELWFLVFLAGTLMILIHTAFDAPIELTIRAMSQQSGIPIALVAIASLSRFRFADVFIKRSFVILAAVVTVLLYSLFVIRPLLRLVRASAQYPEAASWVTMTLLGCLLLLIFPLIRNLIYRTTDRWLFRRPDYRQLAEEFAREIERAETADQLFGTISRRLQSALQVESASFLPNSLETEPDWGLSLPVEVSSVAAYRLTIDPGQQGRKLLSDEMAFLSSLAERTGRRLEALEFERERRERELRESHLQHSLTQAELRALQAQINPHFLFNTLNTIADLIGSEPEKAEAMTEQLAEVFRYVLAQTDNQLISIRQEFDFLKNYLAIEQLRFGDRLQVEMKIDPAVAQVQIPSLLLQPIVENAIKHGLAPKREGGLINILAESENDFVRLTVEDDGNGWNHQAPSVKNNGVGLNNVMERLQAMYDGRAELSIASSAGRGTRISIIIPNHEDQNIDHRRRSVGSLAVEEAVGRTC